MLLLLDTANPRKIEQLFDVFPIDGVTTNPSIIAKEKRAFKPLLEEIRGVIGPKKMLHVQVLAETSDEIVREATFLNETLEGLVYVKIPVSIPGIAAIQHLREKGIQTTATAVFTAQQAFVAAKAGAAFVAPYVNRIDNISGNGVHVIRQIAELFETHCLTCKILGASFKNVEQVNEVALAGAHAVTVDDTLMNSLVAHPLTQWSIEKFREDWIEYYGVPSVFPEKG